MNPHTLTDSSGYGYAQIVIVPAETSLVYIAGQLGDDANGNFSAEFAIQLKQAFANLRTALTAAGAAPGQVVKITILSVDHSAERQCLISAELPTQSLTGKGVNKISVRVQLQKF